VSNFVSSYTFYHLHHATRSLGMGDYFNSRAVQSPAADEILDGTEQPNLGSKTPVATTAEGSPLSTSSTTIQISNTFNYHADFDDTEPNTVIVSADQVFFVVHSHRLLAESANDFAGFLTPGAEPTRESPTTFVVTEQSEVLNVVLHALYNLSCDMYEPTFECLAESIQAMKKYGLLALQRYVSRGTPLYDTILKGAFQRPIETYALAAADELDDLAVASSAYTLHIKLHHIPQELADKMGTWYLQRLYKLHGTRMNTLKELLDKKLLHHPIKPHCSSEQQKVVTGTLQLANAQVLYSASPAISQARIESILYGLHDKVSCPDCKESLDAHTKELVSRWVLVERTI